MAEPPLTKTKNNRINRRNSMKTNSNTLAIHRAHLPGVRFTTSSLSMNRPKLREVLECASPLALFDRLGVPESGRGLPQSKTLARGSTGGRASRWLAAGAALALLLGANAAQAALIFFDDGGTHTINDATYQNDTIPVQAARRSSSNPAPFSAAREISWAKLRPLPARR
jgi:hypothetical protein